MARGQAAEPTLTSQGSSLYVKVRLDDPVKVSALKPGDVVAGKLALDVYSGEGELLPRGSPIRLTVSELGKRRREPNDHWPWMVKIFTPRHESYPLFRSATVTLANGSEVPLNVSLITISQKVEVRAPARKSSLTDDSIAQKSSAASKAEAKKQAAKTIVTLEAENLNIEQLGTIPTGRNLSTPSLSSPSLTLRSEPVTLAAGTAAKIILLGGLSAGKSEVGDSFQARLVEPVRSGDSIVLPEGTLFEGKVMKSQHPRWLSRAGSLLLNFTSVTLPGGTITPVAASVTGADLNQRSHMKIDPEGTMHGDRPGKAWMLINVGTTVGIAKLTDDTLQLIIEAAVSSATDVSTAGSGRIAAICVSGIFLISRRGRDVVLPKFTEMNIMLDRPISLPPRH